MEKLLQYLNSLPAEDRDLFAGRCGTSLSYLRKAVSLGQTLGPALCVSIERASGGNVRRADLRSDWPLIWPELNTTDTRQ
jgi:DNA-binding transcriptional regulator YdaS (Cro superfamily)